MILPRSANSLVSYRLVFRTNDRASFISTKETEERVHLTLAHIIGEGAEEEGLGVFGGLKGGLGLGLGGWRRKISKGAGMNVEVRYVVETEVVCK